MVAGGEGVVREFEMDHVHAAVFKIENHQGPAVSTWDPAQCQVAALTGGQFGGGWMHVYVGLSLCCSLETVATL